MSRKNWRLAVTVLILGHLCARAEAQAPRAPAPPTPPSAAGTDKPTSDALAQEAEAKPKEPEDEKDKKKKYQPLTGQAAAGFSFTQGNSDTRQLNASLVLKYDPRTKDVLKADAFYFRESESGANSVNRSSAHLRDEHALGGQWYAFGDAQYLKDQFKEIDYLFSPTVGAGARLVKTSDRELLAELGAGAIFEKDEPGVRTSSGAVRAGESCDWKLSESATLTESAFGLWKTSDFADAYYHLDLGVGAAINDHFELKVALIDEYKRKPPDPTVKRNDVAGIVSIGYKL